MSDKFTGVTFAEQRVTPSNDASVRRALMSDGILTGCAVTYVGTTLTMAAGQLMICGRQILHPSTQNWPISEATSGYARVVLTIDLTRTSTKETFDQVNSTIEYATAETGFRSLTQSDINASGTVYEVVLCVVALGTGGITSIISQLGQCSGTGSAKTQYVESSGQDADDYYASGVYFFPEAANPANAPDTDAGWLVTLNSRADDPHTQTTYIKQLWMAGGTPGESDAQMWIRTYYGDWGPWRKTLTNILTPNEYGETLPAVGTVGRLYFKRVTT